MNSNMYALSHSERGWLMLSIAFLISGVIYGTIIQRLSQAATPVEMVTGLQLVPTLLLFSLSFGFVLATGGHYVFRVSLRQPAKEEQW
jgi:hypothetical protein